MPNQVPPILTPQVATILALDPGKVTGLALIQPWTSDYVFTAELEVDEVVSVFQSIRDHVGAAYLEVVMEAFTISERTLTLSRELDALDLIGYVKLSCRTLGIPFKLQPVQKDSGFASDSKLKALDWYEKTKDGHKNDALRHLLIYMIQNHKPWSQEHVIPRLAGAILEG